MTFGNPNLMKPKHMNKKKRKTGEGKENLTTKRNKQHLNNETVSTSSVQDTNSQATILQNQSKLASSDLNSNYNTSSSTILIQPTNSNINHFNNNSQSFMPNLNKPYFYNSSNNQFEIIQLMEDKTQDGQPDF